MDHPRAGLPQELEPQEWEKLVLPSGAEVAVGIARPKFRSWRGEPIGNTFGGKPLIDTGGVAEFAELAILRCFQRAGWEGRWLETFGAATTDPYPLTRWKDCRLSEQPRIPVDNPAAQRMLREISKLADGFSGCWDVFAWKNGRYVFAEAKRTGKDAIRGTQVRWLDAALACGCSEGDFILVEWTFSS